MLTLELLREHVPQVQSGDARAKEQALETLIKEGNGLLWKWALDEQRRFRGQLGPVSVEDVHSILMAHYIEALDHVDLDKLRTSATNYLFHRVVSRTRRELHQSYGHMKFSHEFLEGARRVKAIDMKLRDELGREPTDEEIIRESSIATPGVHMGPKDRERTGLRKPVTEAFLKAWRENSVLLDLGEMPTEESMHGYGSVDPLGEGHGEAVRQIFARVAIEGGIADEYVKLLYAVHGVGSADGPLPISEAAEAAGVSQAKAGRVVAAWTRLCRTQGSVFHKVLHSAPEEMVAEAGMADVLHDLGDYSDPPLPLPPALASPAAPK